MSTKVAVVTGGNKGIGFGIVKGLCEKFNGIVYLTARDVQRGENAVKELEKLGYKPKFHQLDINDTNSVDLFREYIQETYGGLDVLVNNAAIAFKHDSTAPFSEQAAETIRVNYFSLVRICHAMFPILRPHARVVNLSSSAGQLMRIPGAALREKLGSPSLTEEELSTLMNDFVESAKNNRTEADGWGNSAYAVSKVGVSALTFIQQRQFDTEVSQNGSPGIIVNAVHPGYVDTDMTSHKGDWTIAQGADAPLYLALLPVDNNEIKGSYVWKDRRVLDWKAPIVAQY
ncbi:uncharacterized protein CBL_08929 [Carabus blaptoides fortunei]